MATGSRITTFPGMQPDGHRQQNDDENHREDADIIGSESLAGRA